MQNVKLLTISQEKYSRPDGNPRGQHGFFLLDYDFVIVAEPFCGVILGFCRGAVFGSDCLKCQAKRKLVFLMKLNPVRL